MAKEDNITYSGINVIEKTKIPQDINIIEPWFNFVRSMRSRCISNGYSGVVIKLIVDEHGMPFVWSEPTVKEISPLREKERLEEILSTLSG